VSVVATGSKRKIKMNNFVKATVRKLGDLSWPDFRDLFSWPSGGSTVQADNPNLLVAKAANERGEVVAYVTAEPVLLVDSFVFNPTNTPIEAPNAGDAIDKALAQQACVNRLWVVIPDEAPPMEGEKVIRVYERRVYQSVTVQRRISYEIKQQATAFLN
jgi:hypothetical protein